MIFHHSFIDFDDLIGEFFEFCPFNLKGDKIRSRKIIMVLLHILYNIFTKIE